jgi:membrane-associated phospholipid phosphatase
MTWDAAGLRKLDGVIWALVAGIAAFVLVAAAFGGFTIMLESYRAPVSICVLLMLGARYYRDRRNNNNIASALESTAQVMAFAAVAAPLSYMAASAALPLQDVALASMDRSLGFDWKGLLAFMHRWPEFFKFMHVIYLSLSVQMAIVVVLLGFTGRLAWLRVYMLAFIFAALITIALSVLFPAEGAWLHYGLEGSPAEMPLSHTSWPVFFGLRSGSFRLLMGIGTEGIITFPSLHAALAVILIAAFWQVPIARWLGAGINSLMLVDTLIDGSHYLVDVLAGVGIAALCLTAARALVTRLAVPPAIAADPVLA